MNTLPSFRVSIIKGLSNFLSQNLTNVFYNSIGSLLPLLIRNDQQYNHFYMGEDLLKIGASPLQPRDWFVTHKVMPNITYSERTMNQGRLLKWEHVLCPWSTLSWQGILKSWPWLLSLTLMIRMITRENHLICQWLKSFVKMAQTNEQLTNKQCQIKESQSMNRSATCHHLTAYFFISGLLKRGLVSHWFLLWFRFFHSVTSFFTHCSFFTLSLRCRDLHCLRNTIHAHLFVTYIMADLTWIVITIQVALSFFFSSSFYFRFLYLLAPAHRA